MKHYKTIEEAIPFLKPLDWIRTNGLSYDSVGQTEYITARGRFIKVWDDTNYIYIESPTTNKLISQKFIPNFVIMNGKNWIDVGTEEEIMGQSITKKEIHAKDAITRDTLDKFFTPGKSKIYFVIGLTEHGLIGTLSDSSIKDLKKILKEQIKSL